MPGNGLAVAPGSVAPVGVRVGAFTIDAVAAGAVAAVAFAAARAVAPGVAALLVADAAALVFGIGQWVAEATTGATVGNALLRIRTLSATTGRPAGFARILLRQLVVGLGSLACGFGAWVVAASGAWDKGVAQRGWHDKAAGTVVLRADAVGRALPADVAGSYATAVARTVGGPGERAPGWPAPAAPALPPRTDPPVPPAPSSRPAPAVPSTPAVPSMSAVPPTPSLPPAPAAPSMPWVGGPVPPTSDAGDVPNPYTGTTPVVPAAAFAPVPPVPAVPVPPPASAADAGLISGPPGDVPPAHGEDLGDLEHTRLRPVAPARSVGLRLAFDTGERVDVVGDGVVGRNPDPQPGVAHLVPIDDPDRSVSKAHLAFGPEGADRLWVVDRGSTNGTVLVRPDGSQVALPAGARATVGAGWSVRFGERTARVEAR
jgi:hypothetical protein